jgi:stage III sporulation protein SpoIIIAA
VRFVHIDVRTRIAGFRHGGTPVLRAGDRVFVAGRCARQDVLAQRIRPLL